ncbi:hypothetical protein ACWCQN_47610 [Streptomyces sp. NPDC001984]
MIDDGDEELHNLVLGFKPDLTFVVGVVVEGETFPWTIGKSAENWVAHTLWLFKSYQPDSKADVTDRPERLVTTRRIGPGETWIQFAIASVGGWTAIASMVRAFINRRKGNSVSIYLGRERKAVINGNFSADEITEMLHQALGDLHDQAPTPPSPRPGPDPARAEAPGRDVARPRLVAPAQVQPEPPQNESDAPDAGAPDPRSS